MNVLEILHVLADDEQVVLPFMYRLELLDHLASAGMDDAKAQRRLLARLHHRRDGTEVEPVVAHVERRRVHKRHTAARTRSLYVRGVVRMHRTDPRSRVFVLRADDRRGHDNRHEEREERSADLSHLPHLPYPPHLPTYRCGLVAFPSYTPVPGPGSSLARGPV